MPPSRDHRTCEPPPITGYVSKWHHRAKFVFIGRRNNVEPRSQAEAVVKLASEKGLKAVVAGEVQESDKREVVVKPWDIVLASDELLLEQ